MFTSSRPIKLSQANPSCDMWLSLHCILQSLANQLHSGDVEVRAAAGEAIALLYHTCGISDLDSFLEERDEPDLSPPASPVSHAQNPGEQKPAARNHLALPTTSVPNPGDQPHSLDAAQRDSQPDASTQAISRSAESHVEPQHGQLSQGSKLIAPELSSQALPEEPESSQNECDQSSASVPAADADQLCQSMNSNPGAEVTAHLQDCYQQSPHTAHSPSNDDAGSSNGNPSQHQPMTPPIRNQTPSTGNVSSGQPPAKSKEGHQGRSKSAVRNPKQQAEAISNGLDDVVSRMKDLATNRGDKNRRSRRDRASTRSTFRELCNVVEVSCLSYVCVLSACMSTICCLAMIEFLCHVHSLVLTKLICPLAHSLPGYAVQSTLATLCQQAS